MVKAYDQTVKVRLLDAAMVEIADRGWGGVRTRAVAERADVNKALIHYHFGSMEQLQYQAVVHAIATVADDSAVALLSADTIGQGFVAYCETLQTLRPDDPASVVLMEAMVHAPRIPDLHTVLVDALEGYRRALRDRLDAAVADGSLPPGTDTYGLAVIVVAMLDGLGLQHWLQPETDYIRGARALAGFFDDPTR